MKEALVADKEEIGQRYDAPQGARGILAFRNALRKYWKLSGASTGIKLMHLCRLGDRMEDDLLGGGFPTLWVGSWMEKALLSSAGASKKNISRATALVRLGRCR